MPRKKMNKKAVGERTEGIILAHLLRMGEVVLIPFGNNQRYDLLVDNCDGTFTRIQCKTAVYRGGCICFSACSTSGKSKRHYRGEADVFFVHCPQLDKIYRIPVCDVGINMVSMRVISPKHRSPISTIRWASEYEVSHIESVGSNISG